MKILVIRFSSIGDIVLTSPVVRCLKNQLPNAEIHFLTKAQYRQCVQANPYIDKIWTIEKSISEITASLRVENFDVVVDLHKNLRTFLLKATIWRFGLKYYSFNKLNFQKWLLVNFKINLISPLDHIVHRCMKTVEKLGVKYDGQGLDFFIKKEAEPEVNSMLGSLPADYVALVAGATYYTKRIPKEKLVEFCKKETRPIFLLGGKEDAETAQSVADICGNAINLCGKLSLHGSAYCVQQASVVITSDTGLMHIAAALRKPIVSVWGSTIPAFGMYPFYPDGFDASKSYMLENKSLACRPCSKIGYNQCPKGHFKCMI